MPNSALMADEDFRADCRESALPDEAFDEQVRCAACGACGSKNDARRCEDADGEYWLCPDCADGMTFLEAISR